MVQQDYIFDLYPEILDLSAKPFFPYTAYIIALRFRDWPIRLSFTFFYIAWAHSRKHKVLGK